jgi:hypothetical protein
VTIGISIPVSGANLGVPSTDLVSLHYLSTNQNFRFHEKSLLGYLRFRIVQLEGTGPRLAHPFWPGSLSLSTTFPLHG